MMGRYLFLHVVDAAGHRGTSASAYHAADHAASGADAENR